MDAGERARGPELGALVTAALARDEDAWRTLVDTVKGVAWKVIYSYDMNEHDRKDVFAATFFRLHEHLGSIREPAKLPGWIATTARNEALASFRRNRRSVPTDELPLRPMDDPDHDESMLDDELHRAVRAALGRLTPHQQSLMRLLTTDPPLSYDEISEALGIPRGSIGPMRQRCLERLRKSPELAAFGDGEDLTLS